MERYEQKARRNSSVRPLESAYHIFRVILHREKRGYSIWAMDVDGAASQGETAEEALENICEVFCGLLDLNNEVLERREKSLDVEEGNVAWWVRVPFVPLTSE